MNVNNRRMLTKILSILSIVSAFPTNSSNTCIQFSVSSGTGCAWMCNYCSTQLGTNNYYFYDNVCTYQSGGCVGNPVAGTMYTCCAV